MEPSTRSDAARAGALLPAVLTSLLEIEYRTWGYGESVAFDGMVRAGEEFSRPDVAGFTHGYFRAWATRAAPFTETDNTIPGDALCHVAAKHDDSLLLDAAARLATWLASRPRGREDVFFSRRSLPLQASEPRLLSRAEAELVGDGGPGLVVDCLHFDPPFFVHLGRLTGDRSWTDLGLSQAVGYARLLQDSATGLYHHFWLERTDTRYISDWGRGQGWALLGLVRAIELAPKNHTLVAELTASLKMLVDGLVGLQRLDGDWHAMVSDTGSGEESSTAAFFSAGVRRAVRLGLIEATPRTLDALDRATSQTLSRISADGVCADVSGAVGTSMQRDHYVRIPTGGSSPWGQGAAALVCLELLQN